jgi:hypothetical protein
VRIGERVSLLTEVRSENGGHVEAYALFVRVRPWRNRTLDIQAGRIPPTFGAFARRDYGGGNPLIGYPLAYQYLTSVRPDAIPATTDDVLRMRARGWRPSYPIGSLEFGPGLSLITAFRWDTGVQAAIGSERLRGTFAVTAGTMSDPRTRDTNDGKQLTGRVEWRPAPGFSLGGSAAHGPYVADAALSRVQLASDDVRSSQQAVGLDTELSRDYWLLRSELIWNRWQVPTIAHDLDAFSGFVEGLYKIRPGFFAAARLDRLAFSELPSATGARSWDAAVTRLEAGGGYYIRRNLVAKGTYQHNWRNGGLVRSRGLLAVQLHFWL